MESFLAWLIGEAGAGWIFGFFGLIGAIYAWRVRERPPYVVVQEIDAFKLLNIHHSQRDTLEVYFSTKPGERKAIFYLMQREIIIYNNGTKDINEEIQLELEALFPPQESSEQEPILSLASDFDQVDFSLKYDKPNANLIQKFTLTIPYLNSYPTHKQFIRVHLIADRPFALDLIKGIGRGWSTKLVSLKELIKIKLEIRLWIDRVTIFLLTFFFLALVLYFLTFISGNIGQAQLNPTPANIQLALQEYKEQLESFQELSFTERLLLLDYPNSQKINFTVIVMLSLFYFLLWFGDTLVTLISNKYLGLQPISKYLHRNRK